MSERIRNVVRRMTSCLAVVAVSGSTLAAAQPPPGNPDEMCGDGTTFTVDLPPVANGLPFGIEAAADSVTLPNGCSIYAIFVSGYSVNPELNFLSFYKLAKFIAERNGYVHYSWWNNLMGEYLSGPLHLPSPAPLVAGPGGNLQPLRLTPGDATHALGFAPVDLPGAPSGPKAVPEEDTQFQADARRMLDAIHLRNPDALIVIAGHSMGGAAVARLGASTSTPIDLLAPIDPVGNRSSPLGQVGRDTYNWTRWRVANNLQGYRRVDCIRDGARCRDFDPRPLRVSYLCQTVDPLFTSPPAIATLAPLVCPRLVPVVVTGARPRIGDNVRMFYHRWQKEFPFPFDFGDDERINRGPVTTLLGGNYQAPLPTNAHGEGHPHKTCGLGVDPRDPNLLCSPSDGHGEIVGLRGTLTPWGIEAQQWPCYTTLSNKGDCVAGGAAARRARLVEMTTAPSPDSGKTIEGPHNWAHEPLNPNLDLVVDDMLKIVEHLLDSVPGEADTTAPAAEASVTPLANAHGWHMDDALVHIFATDGAGSGVEQIVHTTIGAQAGSPVVTSGDAAQELLTIEGETIVQFHARDNAGNTAAPIEFVVRLDRTAPEITAETSVEPNTFGWFNTDVTVMFAASDALSGIASSSPDITIAAEGADQEVTGTAEDLAGNQASALAIINIDRTPPDVSIASPSHGAVFLLNETAHAGYACLDNLSGIASCEGSVAGGAMLDTSEVGERTVAVTAMDRASNTAGARHVYSVHYEFSGFMKPIRPAGVRNRAKAGRVVPVKYALYDANGAPVTDLASFVSLTSEPAACDGSGASQWREPARGPGGTALRYDAAAGQFVFNWATTRGWKGSCRTLRLKLSDGTEHLALFRFR